MRDPLLQTAEKAEMAIASATGLIDEAHLGPMRLTVASLRMRLGYPNDLVVVAIAGGTGSGKSSLFNALAGEELAEVGGVRPTTDSAVAAVPQDFDEILEGLLDHLNVVERHSYDGTGVCLIDLPDYDSVMTEHRIAVDELIPLVDAVVWVVDPEKYRDARLHHEYLQPLARYQSQFVFVLNQSDRLRGQALEQVMADLKVALAEDGIRSPDVLSVSAAPPAGPAKGVDLLAELLRSMISERDAVSEKLATDLHSVAGELSERLGTSLNFDERVGDVTAHAANMIVSDRVSDATRALVRFFTEVAGDVGGPIGEVIRSESADIPRHIARIVGETVPMQPQRRLGRRPAPVAADQDEIEKMIKTDVVRPIRAHLARRALAIASIAEFSIEAWSLTASQDS